MYWAATLDTSLKTHKNAYLFTRPVLYSVLVMRVIKNCLKINSVKLIKLIHSIKLYI